MTESEVGRIFDGVALPHEVKPVVEVCLTTGGWVVYAKTHDFEASQADLETWNLEKMTCCKHSYPQQL